MSLLSLTCFSGDFIRKRVVFLDWNMFLIGVFRVLQKQLRHVLDDWADPLAVEVINTADLLKSFKTVDVSIENLSRSARRVGP